MMCGKHTKSLPIYKVLKPPEQGRYPPFSNNNKSPYYYICNSMKFTGPLYYCLILLLTASYARGQVSFSLQTSAPEIYRNDILQVSYVVTNAGTITNFAPPVFKDWGVNAGPMESQETFVVNGKATRRYSYTYVLTPLKAGKLKLPPTTLTADNHTLSCKPVTITIINGKNPSPANLPPPPAALQSMFGPQEYNVNEEAFGKAPELREQEDPAEKIHDLSFIKVSSNKSTCYVGEPILVTYKLYRSTRSRAVIEKQPLFTACSVKEITFDEQSAVEKLNGRSYIVNTIRKVQLQPLQSGTLHLTSASVLNEVRFALPHKQYREEAFKAVIQNKPGAVEVLPLPQQNKPADFNGVTGQFTIKAQAKENNIPAQENSNLLVTISGKGNLTDIKPPVVNWPAGTEHFEATTEDKINSSRFPTEGSRTFSYHFIASKEGDITIPPIRFSFFNAEKERYETSRTDTVHLHFTKPTGKKHYAADNGGSGFRYTWLILLLLAGAGAGWYLGIYKPKIITKANVPVAAPMPETVPAARPDFIIAFDILSNIEDHYLFFNKSKEVLAQAISEKTNMHNAPFPVLLKALEANEAHSSLLSECRQLHEDCDVAMYSPGMDSSDRTLILDKMKQVLQAFKLIP